MKKIIISCLVSIVLVSCSNPLNKKFDPKTFDADYEAILKSKKLDKEDEELLAALAFFGNRSSIGKTYKQILKEAKEKEKERKELAEKSAREKAEKEEKINNAITISFYDYYFKPTDVDHLFTSYHVFKYAVQNKTDKEIVGVKFTYTIYNTLGEMIGLSNTVSLTDKRIPPKESIQAETEISKGRSEKEKDINESNFRNLKFKITIEKIVFADGTQLEN